MLRISSSTATAGSTNLIAGTGAATGPIAAGGTANQSITVTAPTTPGTYYVWILADNASALTQSLTNNDQVLGATPLVVSAAANVLVVNGVAASYAATTFPYQPIINLTGSGFTSIVTQIAFTCTYNGVSCGAMTPWTASNWTNKYSASSDTAAWIAPVLAVSSDKSGTYNWSVALTGSGQSVTKYFTVIR